MTTIPTLTEKFIPGLTYVAHWPSDSTFRTLFTVTRRSAKFITVEDAQGATKRIGVTVWDGEETALPYGRYSLAPTIRATRTI